MNSGGVKQNQIKCKGTALPILDIRADKLMKNLF